MEKQQNSEKERRKAATAKSKLPRTVAENEVSFLVGSIVEKGDFSSPDNVKPIPPPTPTVLPFPVARHRSHGPHWNPAGAKMDYIDSTEEGANDDEDYAGFTELDPIAAFAKPVHRKEKKGLDLSMRKEPTHSHGSSISTENVGARSRWKGTTEKNELATGIVGKESMSSVSSTGPENVKVTMEMDGQCNLDSFRPLPRTEEAVTSSSSSSYVTDMDLDKVDLENEPMVNAMYNQIKVSKDFVNIMDEQVSTSLENEIDSENCARLQSMSIEEIAEAKAEIMAKMDPAFLELLRKRGGEKLKRKRHSRANQVINEELNHTENNSLSSNGSGSPSMESNKPQKVVTSSSNDGKSALKNGEGKNSVPQTNSHWNAWSERVEAVRELRFSLDGSIVKEDYARMPEMSTVDTATERDILRTEGDPGASGYTIREAVALTRSVISGQRILALNLLASVLDKALQNIVKSKIGYTLRASYTDAKAGDWEAVWSYALGPEPELVLSLRLSLDDNNDAVVLACAKVIQRILSYDFNERFFNISEKTDTYRKDMHTAPVFRSKPGIDVGFLRGGFWKYNVKPSNILLVNAGDDDTEGKHTIRDDLVVAEQDFVAGLVRMGILFSIRYHLEMNPTVSLEECLISILVAIARHSPTCANAILKCPRLVEKVVQRFTQNNDMECHLSKINSVRLLKVLAQSEKRNCVELVENGSFHAVTWNLFQKPSFLDQYLKVGRQSFKLLSSLRVEQLRFWKVCIQNGYCVSDFSHIFPALCLWLIPPPFEKLVENDILTDFASVSREAYLVLEVLAGKLPNFCSWNVHTDEPEEYANDSAESCWSWSHAGSMIDFAMKWVLLKTRMFDWKNQTKENAMFHGSSLASLLWVFSAILAMLHAVLKRVIPEEENGESLPWLPEFVPRLGLEIIRSGFLSFAGVNDLCYGKNLSASTSFMEELCCLRQHGELDVALASAGCVHHLLQVVTSINCLIRLARAGDTLNGRSSLREDNILAGGILESSLPELRCVFDVFEKFLASEWATLQCVETFGRGGPAPGVGVGWGASGGGFWSVMSILTQTDSRLIIQLLEMFQFVLVDPFSGDEQKTFNLRKFTSALRLCLSAGPRDREIVEKALDFMLQVPTLKLLDFCISHLLQSSKRFRLFRWKYGEEDYALMSKTLAFHFRNLWLATKKKLRDEDGKRGLNGSASLEKIPEDSDITSTASENPYCSSLTLEWAHQRLPLPMHWFLSPISTLLKSERADIQKASDFRNCMQDSNGPIEVAKAGLFFLLGIEAVPFVLTSDMASPVRNVPLIWKLHSLSVILLVGMDVLQEDRSRDVYESLQELYGQLLDEARSERYVKFTSGKSFNLPAECDGDPVLEFLAFQSVIHESYSDFIEALVEQYAAVSYGDLLYGRQVALYLHRSTEASLRLATWKTLSNAHVLELLPPIQKCYGEGACYLEPIEENESILEGYANSWVSGVLDKAAAVGSMAFTLVLHHLSSFIFSTCSNSKLALRNKLAKHLLRDYSRKNQHEGVMLQFIQYENICPAESSRGASSSVDERFEVLKAACEGSSSLLSAVQKLRSKVLIVV